MPGRWTSGGAEQSSKRRHCMFRFLACPHTAHTQLATISEQSCYIRIPGIHAVCAQHQIYIHCVPTHPQCQFHATPGAYSIPSRIRICTCMCTSVVHVCMKYRGQAAMHTILKWMYNCSSAACRRAPSRLLYPEVEICKAKNIRPLKCCSPSSIHMHVITCGHGRLPSV